MKKVVVFKSRWMVLVVIVFLLPILGGCQDDDLPDQVRTLEDAYAFITGEWQWTRSLLVNRREGGTLIQTPESEGLTKGIAFGRDRTMTIIENDIVVQNSKYYLEAYDNSFGLWLPETGDRLVVSFRADTLILSNPAFGDANNYIRK